MKQETEETKQLTLVTRVFEATHRLRHYLVVSINIALTGFWLGVLTKDQLHEIDESYYLKQDMYVSDAYNLQGLWDWEARLIDAFFDTSHRILLLGAGGGREAWGLEKRNLDVVAYECNPRLVAYAGEFLERQGSSITVRHVERDECPSTGDTYDGALFGWGGYTLIQGRDTRVRLLKALRDQLPDGAPVLISFLFQTGDKRKYAAVKLIADVFRTVLFRKRLELGDYMAPNYTHYFTKEEVRDELAEAGFEMKLYSKRPYGHAIGIKKEQGALSRDI